MSAILPPKPSIPSDTSNQQAMLDYQEKMASYNMAVQIIQSTENQKETAESNMHKSRNDAMMAIISNFKV